MNKTVFKITIFSLAVCFLTGCEDFLNKDVLGYSTDENFYDTQYKLESALNATYDVLQMEVYNQCDWRFGEACGDDVKGTDEDLTTQMGQLVNFRFNTSNEWIQKRYTINYKGIYRANQVIANAHRVRLADEEYSSYRDIRYILGQAKFLRALFYFNLVKTYGERTVVNHVNVTVEQGKIVGLLGPNGAGKTTTFYMIVGIIRPDEGQVTVDGAEITDMPIHMRHRFGIGYLPQEASIFRDLSVWDNLMAFLETREDLTPEQRKEKAQSLLNEFHINHVRNTKGSALSGGERRRVEIARALTMDPSFILLDEPFAGVDPLAVEDIQSVVSQLKLRGIGILITDHNVRETLHIVDRAYILSEGKILLEGTADEVAVDPVAKKFYLGDNFTL